MSNKEEEKEEEEKKVQSQFVSEITTDQCPWKSTPRSHLLVKLKDRVTILPGLAMTDSLFRPQPK